MTKWEYPFNPLHPLTKELQQTMTDVVSFLFWWLIVSLFGLVTWPILFRVFRFLPDRGYSLAKTGGLLAVGYVGWLLGNFRVVQVSAGGVTASLMMVGAVSALTLRGGTLDEVRRWWAENKWTVAAVEILFVAAFGFWAYVRALNPNITFTEKPMEFAFLNSVLRTGSQPPGDPWLSGYAISYYHFGYVIMGMLIALSGVLPSVGFNLGIALLFALTVAGAFGVALNLVKSASSGQAAVGSSAIWPALLGPLFVLIGNLNGFFEVMHKRGLFSPSFWAWLDIKWTNEAPVPSAAWIPDRFLWWWQASRVIHDRGLTGAEVEVIDEFPFFSFLLGDLHPHVLSLPFVFLAIAFALNLFLGACQKPVFYEKTGFWNRWLPLAWPDLLAGGIILGGLSFLNTWDFPIYVFVAVAAYAVARGLREGWTADVWRAAAMLGAEFVALGVILYLPFYIGFRSQLGGILPNVIFGSQLQQFAVMFGPSLFVIAVWLGWLGFNRRREADWQKGFSLAFTVLIGLIIACAGMAATIIVIQRQEAQTAIANLLGDVDWRTALPQILQMRAARSGVPILLTLLIGVGTAWVLGGGNNGFNEFNGSGHDGKLQPHGDLNVAAFVVVLIVTGALLTLGPEFVYLRDLFGTRMNTVFKFYYQAWVVWSLAAAFGMWMIFREAKKWSKAVFGAGVAVVVAMGLIYPVLATTTVTENWKGTTIAPNEQRYATLDGMAYMRTARAADYAAIKWINARIKGRPVMAEGVGGSYTEFARISAHTGLPTVLGWPLHEAQWRGSSDLYAGREEDMRTLYSARTWTEVLPILDKYNIQYVYVGPMEISEYGQVGMAKFEAQMTVVYKRDGVVIYER